MLIVEAALLQGTVPSESNPFAIVGTLARIFVVLFVMILMSAWVYRFRTVLIFIIGASLLNLLAYTVAFGLTPSLEVENFRQLVLVNMFFVIVFGLVGYVVSRLSLVEQARREKLTTANHQLAQYAGNLEELTVSRERNRMARELHDTLAHTLSGLSVQLETARAFWDVDEEMAKELLDQSLAATRSGLQETRRALQSLRATPLEDLGSVLALKGLAESAESRTGLKLNLDLPSEPLNLTPAIEQAIYRIAQEAVNNVIKHATAQTLTMTLKTNQQIELVVADDGVGFSVHSELAKAADNLAENGHYGLVGLHERAALVNGTVTIDSKPQHGTTVTLTIDRE